MKNITLKIDDETYHQARILAARRETSVSAMVREFLTEQARQNSSEQDRIAALEGLYAKTDERARQKPPQSSPLIPLTREEIYDERVR